MANFGILQPLQQTGQAQGVNVGQVGQPLMGEAPALPQQSLPESSGGLEEIGSALGQLGKLGRAFKSPSVEQAPPVNNEALEPVGNPVAQAVMQNSPEGPKLNNGPVNSEQLYGMAKQYLGNNERDNAPVLMSVFGKMGKDGNINPQNTPWCAAFVNGVLESGGVKGSGSLAARSLLNWGTPTEKPSIGDVVVLSRGNDPTKGHTGFFAGYNQDGSIKVLGGNQNDSVNISNYPANRVLGYRSIPTAQQIQQQVAPVDSDKRLPIVMAGIAHVESGGSKDPYTLISKSSPNGDRAYGKYQIMGNNIPSWSKMATGKSLTPQQFISDPAAQEKIAAFMLNQSLKKGYSPEDAASIWFSGRPQKKAGNSKDVYGTTVPQYIQKFQRGVNTYMNGLKQSQEGARPPLRTSMNNIPTAPGGYLSQPPLQQQQLKPGPNPIPGYLQNPYDL